MGHYINRKTVIDSETGEIMKENNWIGYDGFSDKGYKYRHRAVHIKYFFDSIRQNSYQPIHKVNNRNSKHHTNNNIR